MSITRDVDPAEGPDPDARLAVLDPKALAGLRELDPTGSGRLVARIVQAYVATAERLLPQLREASAGGDLNAVRHVAHTLKSSSASLGATDLSARCAAVEAMARQQQTEGLRPAVDGLCRELRAVLRALGQLPDAA